MESGINKSYIWAWDFKQGWNYTTYFTFFNEFGRENLNLQYVEFAFILFLCLCSLLVNLLLILFFLTKKELRTDQHMYTVCIMVSSILFLPFAVLIGSTRLTEGGWMFGSIACKASFYMLVVTAFIKIWLMTLISVDRYLRVVHPHNRYIGHRLSVALMFAAWILPAATLAGIAYPNTEVKYIAEIYDGITICTVAFKYNPTVPNSLIYFLTVFSAEFLLPTTIMIICYILIMRRISQSTARLLKHTNQSQMKPSLSSKSVDKGLRSNKRRRRTTIILITIVALFLVMWTPLFALLAGITLDQLLQTFHISSNWVVAQVCVMLLNTLMEPFMYSFTTSKVRNELMKTCRNLRPYKSNVVGNGSYVDETSTNLQSCDS